MSDAGDSPPLDDEADRRRAQRIHLDDRPAGQFDAKPVQIIELGLSGLQISSNQSFEPGHFGELALFYEDEDVRARCRVARSSLQSRLSEAIGELVYHIGLEITEIDASSGQSLRNLIGKRVARALEHQRANAMGETYQWDQAIESSSRREQPSEKIYTSCRLMPNGQWADSTIVKPTQPRDGFTVRASATDEEVQTLKNAYEQGSAEERDMIRILAEMSLLEEDESFPIQRFEP